jgi:hypothetical protein
MNLSAKRRVELALPAALLRYVCLSCGQVRAGEDPMSEEENAAWVHQLALLGTAAVEPFAGLHPEEAKKLRRRVDRAVVEVYDEYVKADARIMRVFLITLHWLRDMLNTGALVLVDGSAFDLAVSELLPELERHADLWEAMEKSALKQAPKFHAKLVRLGYYTDSVTEAA